MEYGTATVVDDLRAAELETSHPRVYDREIGERLLYEHPATHAQHYLIRYPAGLRCRLHRHTAAHTIVVLDGHLALNGRVVGPGSYCHVSGGEAMRHQPAAGEPCLAVFIFDGPVDAEPLES